MHEPTLYKLQGAIQHYAWGGFDFIPDLLGVAKSGDPFAEYWLGAHPSQPAMGMAHGVLKKLDALIAENNEAILGPHVAATFGALPYLLKVLDVRQMLSIQVHPNKAGAEKGFEEETEKGIPTSAPNRNYKDANHKPEAMVALSDFWLLHGFKPAEALRQKLESIPELYFLLQVFESGGYNNLYQTVMSMPDEAVNEVLQPLMVRLLPLYEKDALQKSSEDFWAARAAKTFCKNGNYDRGIFSIYFFNLVQLKSGEGIYQPAGMPHAYLEGQNVEIMAASDNVLRAGLTDKYIDIGELMKHVRFEETIPTILAENGKKEVVYKTAAKEFELHKITLATNDVLELETKSAETFLVTDGVGAFQSDEERIELNRGESVLAIASTPLKITAHSALQLFRAVVPDA